MKPRGNICGLGGGIGKEGIECRSDQNALYVWVKFSKNKRKKTTHVERCITSIVKGSEFTQQRPPQLLRALQMNKRSHGLPAGPPLQQQAKTALSVPVPCGQSFKSCNLCLILGKKKLSIVKNTKG